jgi:acyl transferase domain-containing protein
MTQSNGRDASHSQRAGDIAIVGMACLFPGADSLRQFWENIVSKTCSIGDPPASWDAGRYLQTTETPRDRTYCTKGGFLGELARFDPVEFGVMPSSLDGGEPDHFLTLRVATDALRDAGYLPGRLDPERTEVVIGRGTYINRGITSMFQHGIVLDQTLDIVKEVRPDLSDEELKRLKEALRAQLPPFRPDTIPSLIPNILAGRIANRLNIMGANFVVDAACASSLVAIDLGVSDLRSGKCDLAVVGGVNTSIPPPTLMLFSQIEALSRKGELRAFDKSADGTLLGEGVGVVVLKRSEDARRDGDRVYATVKAVGVSSDGREQGLLAPRVEGQVLAMRRAYEAAGVAPDSIGLLEAHGTGVPLGDAVEVQSLARVFAGRLPPRGPCAMGTVKTNVGHLLTASGMAGFIKTALALYHRVLPPTVACDEPHPNLALREGSLHVNSTLRPWVHGGPAPRRAGVNAFGFGGINAHAILEETPRVTDAEFVQLHRRWDTELCLFRAASREELADEVQRLLPQIGADTDVRALAYEFGRRSSGPGARLSIVCSDASDLEKKLWYAAERLRDPTCWRIREAEGIYFFSEPLGLDGRLAFVFPGEGAQYENMLGDLAVHFPETRECFDAMDRVFVGSGRQFLPSQALFPPRYESGREPEQLWAMDTGAELVFAADHAIARLMALCGVTPDAVVGHSQGDYAALVTSGAIPLTNQRQLETLVLGVNGVFERCRRDDVLPEGALLAVSAADPSAIDEVVRQSRGALHVAMENCPQQWVLFGGQADIDAADDLLRQSGALSRRLPFNRAYHTPLFGAFAERLRSHLNEFEIRAPSIETWSCLTAAPFPGEPDAIRDLMAGQWCQKVRFADTITAMYRRGVRLFVEVGPRANLTSFIDNILKKQPHLAVASNVHYRSGITQLQHMLGLLHAHHVKLDPSILFRHRLDSAPSGRERGRPASTQVVINNLLPRVSAPAGLVPQPPPPSPESQVAQPGAGSHSFTRGPVDSRVMAEFLGNMREHARLESEICRLYLDSQPTPGVGAHVRSEGSDGAVSSLPFLDEIISVEPGRSARAFCHLSLEGDRFLRDHALGGHVSECDPELVGLPVVPLTFSMEILAECAQLLAPDKRLVGMRELRARRWIGLDEGKRTLQVVAEYVAADEEGVRVRARVHDPEERGDRHSEPEALIEAECILADRFPDPPAAGAPELRAPRASVWSGRDLYCGFMFHGPSLQGVQSIDRHGQDGILATLRTLPEEALRDEVDCRGLLCDPILLDLAGQVIAYWTSDCLESGYHIFPYRLEALDVFGPPLEPDISVTCRAKIALHGDALIRSDIEILDASGNLHMRLRGWWDQRFCLPERFERVLEDPSRELLSDVSERAQGDQAVVGGATCVLPPVEFLSAHDAIWERVLAHLVLGSAERREWLGLSEHPERRRQ